MSQRPNLTDDYANEGLPTAEDYDPDALGTTQFQAGDPVQQWPEFGLELVPVEYRSKTAGRPSADGWVDTGRRMVNRNGKHLADVSSEYKLLPNEHLVGIANDVAEDLGFGPFHQWEREGDQNDGWYAKLDDHVFQDEDRRRVHAVYAVESGVIGDDDGMEYGFAVHNSIDGSLGFSVGLFSFRHACANMVFLGTGGGLESMALGVESEREILNRHSQKHTHGLDVDREALEATIRGTILLIEDVDATYERWVEQSITAEQVRDLIQRPQLADKDLPGWMREIPDVLEESREDHPEYGEDEPMPWEEQAEIVEAEIPAAETVWTMYNDITEAIWHRGSAGDNTRRGKMKDVHRVLQPAEHGSHDIDLR